MNWKSKQKEQHQRKPAIEYHGQVYKTALTFMGNNPKKSDTLRGKETGIFNKNTHMIIVEKKKSKSLIKKITKYASEAYKKVDIVNKEIHKVNLGVFLVMLKYLGFDICGNITAHIVHWFYKSSKYFGKNMRCTITLAATNRKHKLHDSVIEVNGRTYTKHVEAILKNAKNYGFLGISPKLKENIYTQIFMLMVSMPDKKIIVHSISLYRNSDTSTMATHMVALDTNIVDDNFSVRRRNSLFRIINNYNPTVKETSRVDLNREIGERKKHKKRKNKVERQTFAQMLGIKYKKDLKKLELPYVKARITMLAKKFNTKPSRIVAGIKREITSRCNQRKSRAAK